MLSRPYIQVPISPTIIGRTASTTLFHIVSNMFLVPMLNCLTTNEFIIKIFFLVCQRKLFNRKVVYVQVALIMDSLFTNIPLEKITIPIKLIHNEKDTVEGLCKSEFKMLLTLATKQYYYFQWIIVQKKQIVQSQTAHLDQPFLMHLFFSIEKCGTNSVLKNLNQFIIENMFMIFFVLFKSQYYLTKFGVLYLNICHPNMKFFFKQERDRKLSFSNVDVSLEVTKFVITVY